MYTILNNKSIIYNLQFFCGLIKSFWYCIPPDTVNKIESIWIHGVSNDWFKSCQSNHNQRLSINSYDSGLAAINCGILWGSVLEPLLFLLYINNLNQAIKFCKVLHSAEGTNLFCVSNSNRKLKKLVSADV